MKSDFNFKISEESVKPLVTVNIIAFTKPSLPEDPDYYVHN